MGEGWLRSPALTDAVLEKDREVRALEAELEARLDGSPHRDYLTGRALVNELSASYEIELERLDRTDLYAAAIDYFQLNVRSWSKVEARRRLQAEGSAGMWERRVMEAARMLLDGDSEMTPEGICCLHEAARKEDDGKAWGRFRSVQVGVYGDFGRLVYLAPPPLLVAPLMDRFCEWWNGEREALPLSAGSALAHLFFVVIHPFEDGNGRMSRLLALRALHPRNAQARLKPYAVSPAIYDSLGEYYDTLHRADLARGGDDLLPFVEFIQGAQIRGLRWSLQTLDEREGKEGGEEGEA